MSTRVNADTARRTRHVLPSEDGALQLVELHSDGAIRQLPVRDGDSSSYISHCGLLHVLLFDGISKITYGSE